MWEKRVKPGPSVSVGNGPGKHPGGTWGLTDLYAFFSRESFLRGGILLLCPLSLSWPQAQAFTGRHLRAHWLDA